MTTAKVKKNAITGAKVRNGSLTGEDIDLGKLGTVPSAQSANSLAPMEATHYIGQIGEPQFENGASNLGTQKSIEIQRAGFYRDHDGIVHLQGAVKTGSGPVVFSLPSGFRPAARGYILAVAACFDNGGACAKDSNGDAVPVTTVTIMGTGTHEEGSPDVYNGAVIAPTNTIIGLDGVSFRAES